MSIDIKSEKLKRRGSKILKRIISASKRKSGGGVAVSTVSAGVDGSVPVTEGGAINSNGVLHNLSDTMNSIDSLLEGDTSELSNSSSSIVNERGVTYRSTYDGFFHTRYSSSGEFSRRFSFRRNDESSTDKHLSDSVDTKDMDTTVTDITPTDTRDKDTYEDTYEDTDRLDTVTPSTPGAPDAPGTTQFTPTPTVRALYTPPRFSWLVDNNSPPPAVALPPLPSPTLGDLSDSPRLISRTTEGQLLHLSQELNQIIKSAASDATPHIDELEDDKGITDIIGLCESEQLQGNDDESLNTKGTSANTSLSDRLGDSFFENSSSISSTRVVNSVITATVGSAIEIFESSHIDKSESGSVITVLGERGIEEQEQEEEEEEEDLKGKESIITPTLNPILPTMSDRPDLSRAYTTGVDRSPRNPPTFHSYNTHFSTTCLPKYSKSEYNEFDGAERDSVRRAANSTAQLFSFMSGKYESIPGYISPKGKSFIKLEDSHLLYRTGSRIWEESRESKGQSWLGTRASSTALNQQDDESDEEEDFTKFNAENFKQKFYDSDDDESEDDDGVLHIGGRSTSSSYILNNRKGQEEVDIIVAESRNKNRLIRFADWVLGLGDDSSSTLSEAWDYQNRRVLSEEEKIQIREDETTNTIDVAMGLAIVAYLVWEFK